MCGDGRPAAGPTGHPRHGHERQGLDGADHQPSARRAGADRRHVHEPAPRADQRADQAQRRADLRRGLRRADRRHRRHRSDHRRAADLLRGGHRRRVPMVRRRGRRRGRGRGGHARSLGRHQHRRRPGRRRHERRARPHRVRRADDRRHREGEGRHHQTRERGSHRRDRRKRSSRSSVARAAPRCSCAARTSRSIDNSLAIGGRSLDLRTPTTIYSDVFLPLHGAHQGENASIALAAVETFFAAPLAEDVVHEGFANVEMPGRFEVLGVQPLTIIDGAHNPAGADVCADVFFGDFHPEGRRILVVGTLREPRSGSSRRFAPTSSTSSTPARRRRPAGSPGADVAKAARELGCAEVYVHDSVSAACDAAMRHADADDAILATGQHLRRRRRPPGAPSPLELTESSVACRDGTASDRRTQRLGGRSGLQQLRRADRRRSDPQVVDAAIEHGINYFDTAESYGQGRSEELLGRALGSRRSEVVDREQVGSHGEPRGRGARRRPRRRSAAGSRRACGGSGTDYIDHYQLHRPDPDTPHEETLGCLAELRDEGKIREIGCTHFTPTSSSRRTTAATDLGVAPYPSVQNHYSLLTRDPETNGVFDTCERLGVAFVPYFPLESGLLTGKYRLGDRGRRDHDSRSGESGRRPSSTTTNSAIVERLIDWADAHEHQPPRRRARMAHLAPARRFGHRRCDASRSDRCERRRRCDRH